MITGNFVYLISTLPMLQFGSKPPFSFEKFLQICSRYISNRDIEVLKMSSISGEYGKKAPKISTLKKWRDFDTALRNELVKIRASHRRQDPIKYLRQDGIADSFITHIGMNAHRNPSVLEAEKMLDSARWDALDELKLEHYFDLDFLIVYAHKLLILERWERIEAAEESRILKELVWQ